MNSAIHIWQELPTPSMGIDNFFPPLLGKSFLPPWGVRGSEGAVVRTPVRGEERSLAERAPCGEAASIMLQPPGGPTPVGREPPPGRTKEVWCLEGRGWIYNRSCASMQGPT